MNLKHTNHQRTLWNSEILRTPKSIPVVLKADDYVNWVGWVGGLVQTAS